MPSPAMNGYFDPPMCPKSLGKNKNSQKRHVPTMIVTSLPGVVHASEVSVARGTRGSVEHLELRPLHVLLWK